jgi:hypothetical protein
MFDQIKKAANAVSGTVTDAVGAGVEKLKEPLEDLSAASGAMEQIGYRVGEIELELSLPPRIIVHLHRERTATEEAFQAVLANNADNRTFCLVVGLLRQTNRVADRTPIKGRRLHEVEVSLGLIPSVKLKYAPERSPGQG